jgi:hypothetical protein
VTLLAMLLAGVVAAGDAPLDRVDLGGNTVLVGRVLECSPAGVRLLPASGSEVLLPPSAVKSVVLANGGACNLSAAEARPSRWGTGILAFAVIPVATTVLGTVIGGAACNEEASPACAFLGSIVGLTTGIAVGTAVFVLSGRDAGPQDRAAADPPRAPARKNSVSFAFHF